MNPNHKTLAGHEMKDVDSAKAAGLRLGRLLFAGAALFVVGCCAAWSIVSVSKSGEIADMRQDRDKYFNALQPWQALATRIGSGTLGDLYKVTTNALAGQNRIESKLDATADVQKEILQALTRTERENRYAFTNDFPLGYALYSLMGVNVISPTNNSLAFTVRWNRFRLGAKQDRLEIRFPDIVLASDNVVKDMTSNLPLRAGAFAELKFDPEFMKSGRTWGNNYVNFRSISITPDPTISMVAVLIDTKPAGYIIVVGLRPIK